MTTYLVAGAQDVDAGKTTFSVGLLAYLDRVGDRKRVRFRSERLGPRGVRADHDGGSGRTMGSRTAVDNGRDWLDL
jgi:formyltetrahydrofolate synthetase